MKNFKLQVRIRGIFFSSQDHFPDFTYTRQLI